MLEEKELQELERALQAATPAPWDAGTGHSGRIFGPPGTGEIAFWDANDPNDDGAANVVALVAARNAAPSLVSDLREARRLLGDIHQRIQSLCEYKCDSRVRYHAPTCLRGRILALLGIAPEAPPESNAVGSKVAHDPREERE